MKLKFEHDYKSLTPFQNEYQKEYDLPDFFVLTGKNGSGKTQLFEMLKNGHAHIHGIEANFVLYYNYIDFIVADRDSVNEEDKKNSILSGYQNTKSNYISLIDEKFSSGLSKIDGWHTSSDKYFDNIEKYKENLEGSQTHYLEPQHDFFNAIDKEKVLLFLFRDKNDLKIQNILIEDANINNFSNLHNFDKVEKLILDIIKTIKKDDMELISEIQKIEEKYNKKIGEIDIQDIKTGVSFAIKDIVNPTTKWYEEFNNDRFEYFDEHGEKLEIEEWEKSKSKEPNPITIINSYLKTINFNYFLMVANPKTNMRGFSHYESDVVLVSERNQNSIRFADLSSGEQILFGLAVFLSEANDLSSKILLLDEIDATLHPSMAETVMQSIKSLCVDGLNMKVIMSTHSPSTVAYADDVCLIDNQSNEIIKSVEKQEALSVLSDGICLLNDAQIFYNIPEDRLNILTEGNNIQYFRKAIELIEPSLLDKVNFIEGIENRTGATNLTKYSAFVGLISELLSNAHFMIVLDNDGPNGEGQREFTKINSEMTEFNTNNITPYQLRENTNNTAVTIGVENLLPPQHITPDLFDQRGKLTGAGKQHLCTLAMGQTDPAFFAAFQPLIKEIEQVVETTQ